MAHISPQRMVAIIRDRKLSKSLRITESDLKSIAKHVCDVCVRSKSTRSSHTGSLIIDKRLGSTFAYDLQGPFNTPSIMYNNIYMFGIIEYNSRYVWPFFGKNKSDVYAIFKYWLENEFTQIRALNSQLGQVTLVGDSGEAKSDNMRKILAQHAIKQVFTSYNTPEQNAVIERVWRTLGEMATCMLLDADLPETYWEEARRYSVFIYNRLPPSRKPKVGPWEAPMELLYKSSATPIYKHFHPFGTPCVVHIPSEKRGTKSHAVRGQRGRFIGFEEEGVLIYRVYITATAEVVGTTDVVFLRRDTNTSDIPPEGGQISPTPTHIPVREVNNYQNLVGTRLAVRGDGMQCKTTRVLQEGEWIVSYRRLILTDGTTFKRTEYGPFHVRDIEVYTEGVGVVRAELLVDKDDILTDPEDDSNCYHTPPLLLDASVPGRGGTHSKVHNSKTKPAGLPSTHDDVVSHGKSDNTSKEGSSRRDSRRSISQGTDSTLVRKRVRFQGDQHDDQKLSAEPQSLTETAVSTPQTGTDSEHSDTDDQPSVKPRRPGLRPRVKQRLAANALAGNVFCTIAMVLLTVTACTVLPNIAIHPTAIQPDPLTRAHAIQGKDRTEWILAEQKEIDSLKENNVFTECDLPKGRKTVKTKWIYKKKLNKFGAVERYKARLVAQGFTRVEGIDFNETYSPVARFTSIRLVLALAAMFGYRVHQMDVDTAFLNAELQEEVYVTPPPGYALPKGRVYRLNRCLYGLKQSPRGWYSDIDEYLVKNKFVRTKADSCIYTRRSDKGFTMIALYVDDLIIAGSNDHVIGEVKNTLRKKYKMKDLGLLNWVLGMEVIQDIPAKFIRLNLSTYVKQLLDKFDMTKCHESRTPMDSRSQLSKSMCSTTEGEKLYMASIPYREAVGSLLWLANGTRPNIAYAVNQVARYMDNPGPQHWEAVLRIIQYLKGSQDKGIVFTGDVTGKDTSGYFSYPKADANIFVDADHAGHKDDRRSVTGYVFMLSGGPISWQSRSQTTVALSSMEAEYMAACAATQESLWLAMLMEQMGIEISRPIILKEDNKACIAFSKNPGDHKRSKHIDCRYHFVRERVAAGDISLEWISTTEQVADIFTKALDPALFLALRESLVH